MKRGSKCKNFIMLHYEGEKVYGDFLIIYFFLPRLFFPNCAGFWTQKHISNRKLRKNLLIYSSYTLGSFKAKSKGKGTCGWCRKEHMASALVENLNTGSIGIHRSTSINMPSELFWQNTKWSTLAQHSSQECCNMSPFHLPFILDHVIRNTRIQRHWKISVYQICSQIFSHKQYSC